MPRNFKKPCRQPGCPELTHETYCVLHRHLDKRKSGSGRGYNSKWHRLSKLHLKAHPLCEECKRHGKLTPATVVDHIIPHRRDECLMWDETNWQSLCKPCHDKKTGKHDSLPVYKYK